VKPPAPENGAEVDRTACGPGAGRGVYLNGTVTDKSKQSVYDGSRLKVDYVEVDGQWLINYITPI
jgi:hypothetical protein